MPELRTLHYINAAAFAVNILVTYGSQLGWFGPDNANLSNKYQTLVTPAGWAFSIWGLIFMSEAVFVGAQLFPRFRDSLAVHQGVGYWWCAACFAQSCWTPLFAQELMVGQLIAMLSILGCLAGLVRSCATLVAQGDVPVSEYWLFIAPFSLHLGWIVAASTVSVNVTLLKFAAGESAGVAPSNVAPLLASAIVSFAVVLVVAFSAATHLFAKPNAFVPGVAAWALFAISAELSSPRDSIADAFSADTLSAVQQAARVLAIIASVLSIAALGVRLMQANAASKRAEEGIAMAMDSSLAVGI